MPENKTEMISISCPECGKQTFTFSKNAINPKNGISFTCQCGYKTYIEIDKDGALSISTISF